MTAMTNAPTLPADDLLDRIFNRSTHTMVTDGEGKVYSAISVKLIDLEALRALATTLRDQLAEAQREIERLKEDAAWIRKKVGVPEDTPMFSGKGPTLAGKMHVLCHCAHGYTTYIEAFKCDDKQGEIARLTVKAAEQTARADANEKDARRYRWMRDSDPDSDAPIPLFDAWVGDELRLKSGADLDAAIDAAIDALAKS